MKKLILLECDNFQKPYVKKILREAEQTMLPEERKPDLGHCTRLARATSAIDGRNTKHKPTYSPPNELSKDLVVLQEIADYVTMVEADAKDRQDDRVVRMYASQNQSAERTGPYTSSVNLFDVVPEFTEAN